MPRSAHAVPRLARVNGAQLAQSQLRNAGSAPIVRLACRFLCCLLRRHRRGALLSEALADHWLRGELLEQALEYLVLAGEQGRARPGNSRSAEPLRERARFPLGEACRPAAARSPGAHKRGPTSEGSSAMTRVISQERRPTSNACVWPPRRSVTGRPCGPAVARRSVAMTCYRFAPWSADVEHEDLSRSPDRAGTPAPG